MVYFKVPLAELADAADLKSVPEKVTGSSPVGNMQSRLMASYRAHDPTMMVQIHPLLYLF